MSLLERYLYQARPSIRAIIHAGASHGEELPLYTSLHLPFGLLLEPDPAKFPALKKACECFPLLFPYQIGASDRNGQETLIHLSGNKGHSDSILKPKKHLKHHPVNQPVGQTTIQVRRVDDLLRENGHGIGLANFLVLDVQGYELKALHGMEQSLRFMESAVIEVNQEEMYEGCALVHEIDEVMGMYGMKRIETDWDGPDQSYGDALYMRRS